jgi:hypothetical protein
MLRLRLLSAAIAGAMLTGCEFRAEDHGPPLVVADVPIAPADGPRILSASRRFAAEHGLSFDGRGGESGFAIFMKRGELAIHGHNSVDPARAEVGASDDGKRSPNNIKLAEHYVDLVKQVSSRAP